LHLEAPEANEPANRGAHMKERGASSSSVNLGLRENEESRRNLARREGAAVPQVDPNNPEVLRVARKRECEVRANHEGVFFADRNVCRNTKRWRTRLGDDGSRPRKHTKAPKVLLFVRRCPIA
jgi:hypothetical protein